MKTLEVHAATSRKKDSGYPFTQRVGTAFVRDNGMIDVTFDFCPPATPNKDGLPSYRLTLMEPRADAGQRPSRAAPARSAQDDDDSDIPF